MSRPKAPEPEPGRQCAECRVCCHLYYIHEPPEESPRWEDCHHQGPKGCGIYARRPDGCRDYRCAWLTGWGADPDRPDRLGFVLEELEARPSVRVEAAWLATETGPGLARREPARGRLKELAKARRLILVDYGARGNEGWGQDLPADF